MILRGDLLVIDPKMQRMIFYISLSMSLVFLDQVQAISLFSILDLVILKLLIRRVETIPSTKRPLNLRCTPKAKVNSCLSFLGGTESILYR